MSNIVAIVGRPNVGKSTLFNRLTQTRSAIVDSVSGVTRDRHYGKSEWNGIGFSVIDTGGYIDGSDDVFEDEIKKQIELAIEESDVILFLVDVSDGVTSMDEDVAKLLRKTTKPSFLVVNKVDNSKRVNDAVEFYSLGYDNYYCISSSSGSGTGDLLDSITRYLNSNEELNVENIPRLAFVGIPNVGKSSMINTLLGKERNIVTNIAGTTRDSIHTHYKLFGYDFMLTDTAGLRKKSKVNENLEFYSVMRTVRAIENSDVCLLLIDALKGFNAQDLKIFHLAEKNNKGVVILVNKWDLVNKETFSTEQYTKAITDKIAPFIDVPILFTSAITKQRVLKAMEVAISVWKRRKIKIKTSELNDFLQEILKKNPPPSTKGKYIKIKYCTQLPTYTPSFALFANLPQYVKDPYKRFIENKLREKFGFSGVPINIYFRKK